MSAASLRYSPETFRTEYNRGMYLYQGPELKGDQPKATERIVGGIEEGLRFQTLLGATGTGKTVTMAKIIAQTGRPALIMAPNKVLAAQLAAEFRAILPQNAVEFFISYYDYYQPEAYVPGRDLFIEKDASINPEIERLRHSTTRSLLTRRDVVVVASVSAIYGLGNPEDYRAMNLLVETGAVYSREAILERMVALQYTRNDVELAPGRFRVRGEVIEVWPAYDTEPLRVEMFGNEVERIVAVHPVSGEVERELPGFVLFPATHYATPEERLVPAIAAIEAELAERVELFEREGRLLEAQRVRERTVYDLEMLKLMGHCAGIENYSRHLTGRAAGQPPPTLLDYFPEDSLCFFTSGNPDDLSRVMLSLYQNPEGVKEIREKGIAIYQDHKWELQKKHFTTLVQALVHTGSSRQEPVKPMEISRHKQG
jgi:excinuclease ABC subunit B